MPVREADPAGPIPAAPGTYALLFHLPAAGRLQVGRLGLFSLPAGYCLYLGSALGPGGLAGRLGRHLRPPLAPHWHVDYLRRVAAVVELWWAASPVRGEHEWAAAAGRLTGATIPVPRFGAGDCRCPAHLYHYPARPAFGAFRALIGHAVPEAAFGRHTTDE
jgi:Uri superfamily endonuclease